MIKKNIKYLLSAFAVSVFMISCTVKEGRIIKDFNADWKFNLGNDSLAFLPGYSDTTWRILDLPHDWSIEGEFSQDNPTKQAGGCLPAGIGWYRKTFKLDSIYKNKKVFIEFDGIYRNSEVWINGHYLSKRPYGYISFQYDLTRFLNFKDQDNVIAVKVDNSLQPNSRWYTGSGIYRNVRLVITDPISIGYNGTSINTTSITEHNARVNIEFWLDNYTGHSQHFSYQVKIRNSSGKLVAKSKETPYDFFESQDIQVSLNVKDPQLWSTDHPNLYTAEIIIYNSYKIRDIYKVSFGIRYFKFDAKNGFFLNGKHLKILGVCNHHDLGALGAAFNKRAAERQLEILKDMGCNAIRTAHNPPAPELLDLCDKMGFLVMDESFDEWKKKRAKKGYHIDFEDWHIRDLYNFIKRDRNHPSVIIWSIGNEIREQFDSTGIEITNELVKTVKLADTTRPITSALTENIPEKNYIYQSHALDILGFNYKQNDYKNFPQWYPGEPVIITEGMSAFATRGTYNMPSDSIQRWPEAYGLPLKNPNPDHTVSAYDHISAYWGSTHEETWKVVKNLDFISGLFVWSGFDFIGEPEPYGWPSRSSYYGIIDLAGFPKDAYYMYQSEWTDKTMLHLFPHWNWEKGQIIDVWAYYNNADEVELFLNDKSLGSKSKSDSVFHVMWRIPFEPGIIKAVSKKDGEIVMVKEIKTAGEPEQINLSADRATIKADGYDLSFITVKIFDNNNNLVPFADNPINFSIKGPGKIVGVDNGYQANLDSFKANNCKAFKGKCLVIIKSEKQEGNIRLTAESNKLKPNFIIIKSEN